MSKFLKTARSLFTSKPLLANCVIYGTIYTSSEFLQQTLLRKALADSTGEPYDLASIARFAVLGFTVLPPMNYQWYKWLDGKFVGTALTTVAKKMVLDQTIIMPIMIAAFFIGMSIMERKDDILYECKQKLVPTFQSSCLVWVPAQAVNFFLVPAQYRVVYVACVAFVWANILCFMKRKEV